MKRIVARLFVKEESVAAFKGLFAGLAEKTRQEDGCLFYCLYEDVARPGDFLCYEEYCDQAAVDRHMGSAHLQAFLKGTASLQARPPIVDFL